jgi:hypothetical protein
VLGETIGNFRIVERLGAGGMGEVWLAEQQNIGTKVAIKLLKAEISDDTEHVERFFNEARAVSRIQHAGIVKIFDVGHHAGRAYLIMEFLDGESLARRLRAGTRLAPAVLADLARQIASVLDATHSAGITHRDLKPDNIYLVPDREIGERVKVLDFGIAKLTGTLAQVSPRTTGTLGTPAYMAPEQWGDASKVDGRADLYSLGCVAFEMATGRPPFVVTNIAEACAKHLHDPPPRLSEIAPDVPRPLEDLVAALLSKVPAERPGVREAERRFAAIRDGVTGGSLALATTAATTQSHRPRRRWPLWLAGVAAVGIGATAFALVRHDSRSPQIAKAPVVVDAAVPLAVDAAVPPAIDAVASAPIDAAPAHVAHHAPSPPAVHEGTIDAEAVFRVVSSDPRVQRCYLDALKTQPTLGGKLMATAKIGTDGRATDTSAIGVSDQVSHCIAKAIAALRFPAAVGGPVVVNFPMSFDPPDPLAVASGRKIEAVSAGAGDVPTAVEIADGTRALTEAVAPCADSWQGDAHVQLEISPDGRVRSAVVLGSAAGSSAGACIEKTAISKGRFAASKSGTTTTVVLRLH